MGLRRLFSGLGRRAAACLSALAVVGMLASCAGAAPGLSSGSGSNGGASSSAPGIPNVTTVSPDALSPLALSGGQKLKVVATTSLVAEAVKAVGGDRIDLSVMVGRGVDAHDYQPSPQDIVDLSQADVIMMSGFGYEAFLATVMNGAAQSVPVVALSEGILPIRISQELAAEGASSTSNGSQEVDPHVWLDPQSVVRWTTNASAALSALDPVNAAFYQTNADNYIRQLNQLDQWAFGQIADLPENNRKLVTGHQVLGYLARRYGLRVVGSIRTGASDLAEPSAQELAALEDALRQEKVKAIFVGFYDNHSLADQVAQDTGIKVVPLYLESLSGVDGPAATYIDFIHYDVTTLVEALK